MRIDKENRVAKKVGKKTARKANAGAKAVASNKTTSRSTTTKAASKKKPSARPKAGAGKKSTATPMADQRTKAGSKLKKLKAKPPAPAPTAAVALAVAPPAQVGPREPLPDAQLRKAKSGLSKADLQRYRSLLLTKRAELRGDVEALESDARKESGDHFSPEHMADTGTNHYEQEFTLGLVESEQRMLREIDEALLRIRSGTYGVCVETAEPIGKERLDAKLWAKYCIDVAREKERLGQL